MIQGACWMILPTQAMLLQNHRSQKLNMEQGANPTLNKHVSFQQSTITYWLLSWRVTAESQLTHTVDER